MSRTNIDQIELDIQQSRQSIELGKALERLQKNGDFKKLIQEHYMERMPINLVILKSAPQMQAPERQADLLRQMDAIGSLAQYFHAIRQNAEQAMKKLEDDEQTRDELLNEGI